MRTTAPRCGGSRRCGQSASASAARRRRRALPRAPPSSSSSSRDARPRGLRPLSGAQDGAPRVGRRLRRRWRARRPPAAACVGGGGARRRPRRPGGGRRRRHRAVVGVRARPRDRRRPPALGAPVLRFRGRVWRLRELKTPAADDLEPRLRVALANAGSEPPPKATPSLYYPSGRRGGAGHGRRRETAAGVGARGGGAGGAEGRAADLGSIVLQSRSRTRGSLSLSAASYTSRIQPRPPRRSRRRRQVLEHVHRRRLSSHATHFASASAAPSRPDDRRRGRRQCGGYQEADDVDGVRRAAACDDAADAVP